MEKGLKERIAVYVEKIGVKRAIEVAEAILSENTKEVEKFDDVDAIMAQFKVQLAVLEYLHCDSELVDKYSELLP